MSSAPHDERIDDLLVLWEEMREQGQTVSAESLCRDCPEVASELARRMQALTAMDRVIDARGNAVWASASGPAGVTSATTHQVRYSGLRFHAEGGLGQIFTGHADDLRRDAALKFIRQERAADAESRRRFLFEAEVTGQLEHPGVVAVYGVGSDDRGLPCYAMRLIHGETLQDALDAFHRADRPGRNLAERSQALRLLLLRFISVCNTVAYAHSRGVLHRDLKPKNVMIGAFGETLVVDWGLARRLAVNGIAAGGIDSPPPADAAGAPLTIGPVGSPGYMSPEQSQNEAVGPASDIYSLGAMLYALLTSRPPITGSTAEVIEKARRNEFPPARAINPAVHPALEAICAKAMATRPEHRYRDALALAADIDFWLADAPVSAWRAPVWHRVRRWARRNRTAVSAACAALVAGLIALAVIAIVQAQHNSDLSKANDETRRALARSEDLRREADAVLSFLKSDVLAAARPADQDGGLGTEVTIRLAVDAAEPKIARVFNFQPVVEADLRDTLGTTYRYLGQPKLAIRQFERAVELRESQLGRDHPDTLTSRDNLAGACLDGGRIADAVALHESALRLRESRLGRDHPDTLSSCNNLGVAYLAAGRTADGIALHAATLKRLEMKVGPTHHLTLDSRNNLAQAYHVAGRDADAIALQEATLELYKSELGSRHPDTLASRHNLAAAFLAAGRTADAIALHEATLKLYESELGRDHPDTLKSRNDLALDYLAAGRISEATALDKETLKLRESQLGPDHPDTLTSRNNLAQDYLAAGRAADAIDLDERTLKLREVKLGPDHPLTLISRNNLLVAYIDDGRWAAAESLSSDILARLRRAPARDTAFLARALGSLGLSLLMQAAYPEAETVLRECLAIRETAIPDGWLRFNTMSQLGGALLGQGRHADAAPLIVGGYEGLKAREDKLPASGRIRLSQAALRVAQLYASWGKPREAAAWKARLGLADLPSDVFGQL
jgi:tetratricopeptide (TPR) repeat protein/tRNA A-37 threonylcarbamoyl transferase component Bud32